MCLPTGYLGWGADLADRHYRRDNCLNKEGGEEHVIILVKVKLELVIAEYFSYAIRDIEGDIAFGFEYGFGFGGRATRGACRSELCPRFTDWRRNGAVRC